MKEPNEEFIKHTNTGRPLGDNRFIERAERISGRELRKKKPGSKVERDK